MSVFHSLRQSRLTLRAALVWFALAMAVSVLAPALKGASTSRLADICSVNTAWLSDAATPSATGQNASVDSGAPVPASAAGHLLHCVFCLPTALPTSDTVALNFQTALTDVWVSRTLPTVRWRIAAPTSARDPPSLI